MHETKVNVCESTKISVANVLVTKIIHPQQSIRQPWLKQEQTGNMKPCMSFLYYI